jgi:hypothetical protein
LEKEQLQLIGELNAVVEKQTKEVSAKWDILIINLFSICAVIIQIIVRGRILHSSLHQLHFYIIFLPLWNHFICWARRFSRNFRYFLFYSLHEFLNLTWILVHPYVHYFWDILICFSLISLK